MNIGVAFDDRVDHIWSTPVGFENALRKQNYTVTRYGFDPHNCNFNKIIDESKNLDFVFFMLAGPASKFDEELKHLKQNSNIKILMELGDDLPNSNCHHNRLMYLDGIFTSDYRCDQIYKSKKLPSVWFPCWCDDAIFYKDKTVGKNNVCVTTCGDRPYVETIKRLFPNKFLNKKVWYHDNTKFFNSGTISYQYARYDEITRRLFEAGGCDLAILTNRISENSKIYDLFKEDHDIVYFSTETECIQKMTRLFYDEEFRNKISSNMYKNIQQNHLIEHRVNQLISFFKGL